MSIFDLGLSRRAVSRLYSSGILTAEELMQKPDLELMKIRGFGDGCLAEVKDALWRHGYTRKKTNADRIRAMSDEELAKLLVDYEYQVTKEVTETLGIGFEWEAHEKELSIKEILERLQQPAEEG